ncbi:hypothetical protein HRbin30_01984 [bacterium HR30]|nr:hypothetical protein HRbin30_01984 [bacterium HR30]
MLRGRVSSGSDLIAWTLPICLALGTVVPLVLAPRQARAQSVTYVNRNAAGRNDRTSWADAYVDLQQAIANRSAREIALPRGSSRTQRRRSHFDVHVAEWRGVVRRFRRQ